MNFDLDGVLLPGTDTVGLFAPSAAGLTLRLAGGTISVNAAASVQFIDANTGANKFRTPVLQPDTPYTFVVDAGLLDAANDTLGAVGSASCAITGTLYGTQQ